MWHVSSRSGVATSVNCYTLVTYLLVCDAVWLLYVTAVVSGLEAWRRRRVLRVVCGCCLSLWLQLSGLNSGSAHATLVDFGSTVDCSFATDIFTAVHVDVPSFAYRCTLAGADERPAAAVVRLLRQYDSNVALSARCVSRRRTTGSSQSVELVDTRDGRDVCLVDLLLLATAAAVPPPAEMGGAGSVEYVYVTSVTADATFFGQLAKYDTNALEQFRTRLNDYYRVNAAPNITGPNFIISIRDVKFVFIS